MLPFSSDRILFIIIRLNGWKKAGIFVHVLKRPKPIKMRKIFTLIAASFLTASAALAQSGTRITGLVKDAQARPLAAATVSLLRAADSSLVKLAVSGKTGVYEFAGIQQGRYLLSVT